MGKPRVRGQHTNVYVMDHDNKLIQVGEISKFSVKELGELKKSRAIGDAHITGTKTFEGFDLSFEGGKVDWKLAQLLHKADVEIYNGERAPYFVVKTTFNYAGGTTDSYTYPEVTIHGYNLDVDANDELMEKFEGFCGMMPTYTASGTAASEERTATLTIDTLITKALDIDNQDRG